MTVPLVVLLGVALFFMVRYGRLTLGGSLLAVTFGLFLAGTPWGTSGQNIATALAEAVARGASALGG